MLVLTRNFPPLRGGMERLVQRLTGELAGQWRVALVGPAGCAASAPAQVDVTALPLRPLAVFLLRALLAGRAATRRLRPQVILCGSGLLAPVGRLLGRLYGLPVACLLHGLDVVADHPVYRRLFLPAIRGCDLLIVNSRHTEALARAAGVPQSRLAVLHPGADATLPPPAEALHAFRARHRLTGPVILSVGRLTRRKGLLEFVQRALPRVLKRHPDATLLVVGGEANQALGRARVPVLAELERAIAALGLATQVRLAGDLPDGELDLAYASATALAFPVLELPGDVEGFGMVALEAAAHGVPTVAFAVGGVPDAVSPGCSGLLLTPGDYAGFADALNELLDGRPAAIGAAACREFAAGFSWSSRGVRLRALLGALAAGGRA